MLVSMTLISFLGFLSPVLEYPEVTVVGESLLITVLLQEQAPSNTMSIVDRGEASRWGLA